MSGPMITGINSLQFKNLTYAHDGGTVLFDDVSFDFPTNEMILITGLNGSGRSSLLQLMAGLSQPQSGGYYLNGQNVTDMSFEEFLSLRLNIGYSFDMGGLLVNRSLEDNLMLPMLYHQTVTPKEARERAEFFLVSLGIFDQRHERPAHVSGGTRKTGCLLRSMIMKPELLLLDDPTVGLSRDSTQLLVALIEMLVGEGFLKHIFVASHDERFLSCFEHRTMVIHSKDLKMQDPSEKSVVSL